MLRRLFVGLDRTSYYKDRGIMTCYEDKGDTAKAQVEQ